MVRGYYYAQQPINLEDSLGRFHPGVSLRLSGGMVHDGPFTLFATSVLPTDNLRDGIYGSDTNWSSNKRSLTTEISEDAVLRHTRLYAGYRRRRRKTPS